MCYHRFMRIKTSEQIGTLVHSARVEKGWTQKELAEKAMVSPRWIVLLEKGQNIPRLDLALRTLTALGLGVSVRPLPQSPLDDLLKT